MVIANTVLPIPSWLPDQKITFIELKNSFVGRSIPEWDEVEFNKYLVDKATRRRSGIITAAKLNMHPAWYFMADADDYVSDDLVSTIISTTELHHKIATVNSGLIMDKQEQSYVRVNDINKVCGTSIAVSSSLIQKHIDDGKKLGTMLGQHEFKYFKSLCGYQEHHSLGGIPRVIYVQHDQNYSGNTWANKARLVEASPLTDEIRQKFGIFG
jgi:hypothetical protein